MAIENKYKITVNTKTKMFRQVPEIVANDNVVFEIEVWDDSVKLTLLPEYTYKFVSKKPKGNPVMRDATEVSGLVRVELGYSEMTEPGKVEGTLQIFDAAMKRISSVKIDYIVKKDPSLDGDLPNDERNLVIVNESLLHDTIDKSDTASSDSATALTKATTADTNATSALTTANTVKDQFNQVVAQAGSNNPEVVQARGGEVNLNARLDKVTTQLAEKATQSGLNTTNTNVSTNTTDIANIKTNKADKTYVDTQVQAVASGSPKGVYATLTALQSAFPTGNTNTYLVTADGKWYYWSGSAWTAGGTYQSTGIAADSITEDKVNFIDTKFIVDNITAISVIVNSDRSIALTITNKDAGITFWAYHRNGNSLGSISLASTVTYTLPPWQRLIWDLTDNTIKINDGSAALPAKYFILAINSWGKISDGHLARIHHFQNEKLLQIQRVQVVLDSPDSLYMYIPNFHFTDIDPSSTRVYFKYSGNMIVKGRYNGKDIYDVFPWSTLYNAVPVSEHDQSVETAQGCITIRQNKRLVYNILDMSIKIKEFGEDDSPFELVLVDNNSSSLGQCALFPIWVNKVSRLHRTHEDTIPLYFENEIKAKENEVIGHMDENTVNLAFTTDNHTQEHIYGFTLKAHNILNKIDSSLNLAQVVDGGDNILYGTTDVGKAYGALKAVVNKFHDKSRYMIGIGNHDSNGYETGFDKSMLLNDITKYNILGKHMDHDVVWGSKQGMYYYKDLENQKIRLVMLNSSDIPWVDDPIDSTKLKFDLLNTFVLRNTQLNWLANTALNFSDKANKSEWHTLVFCHVPILDVTDGMTANNAIINKPIINGILEAFAAGTSYNGSTTGDFAASVNINFGSQGAMPLIGIYSGHIHLDRLITKNGVNHVTTMAGYPSKWTSDMPDRNVGEVSEVAFDVLTINKAQRKVNLTRIGAGSSRQYTY